MEGGKGMKTKIILKSIFVFFLTLILIGLLYIIFSSGDAPSIYSPLQVVDYKIQDDTEACPAALELIYSDNKYNYYLSCIKSANISIIWDDGVVDSLKNAIEKEKVTIESLERHGLEIIKNEK